MTKIYKPQDFGYQGHEMLMNPITGSVASAEEWISEIHIHLAEREIEEEGPWSPEEDGLDLIEVEKINGEWVAVE